MREQEKYQAFGIKDKIGYLFGNFGNDFTFLLSSGFLMKFYTDVMGVEAGIVGTIMMAARLLDAFTDVTMGRICDRSKQTAVGKFKPWIRRMCAPVAIASFLIYQSSLADYSTGFKVIWLSVTYILWGSIFYTSINIPYGSMASAISAEPSDRQSLSTYRTLGSALAGLITGAGIPMYAYEQMNGKTILNGEKFTCLAGVFSVLAVGCYLLCYYLTTERIRTETSEERIKQDNVIKMLKRALSNRALISIIVASTVMLLAQLTMQGMANYIFPNYYGSAAAQTASTFTMVLGMVFAAVVAKRVSMRYGKAEVGAAASVVAAVIHIVLYVFRPENVWVYVAIQSISWLGLGIFSVVSWALITDVIDDLELRNGMREDGSVYALYSFSRKAGQAASSGLTGALLEFIGYHQTTAFEPHVLRGIYDIAAIVPALGFLLLAAVLWFWYPLHKTQVDRNVEALRRKYHR